MNEGQENALGRAASAYLRSARYQPVAWHEWGAEAFAKAAAEDKPVLLDIGAVWCHWCHVMDRESYESSQTAEMINDLFIAVKVDRDERPDVDTRYQAAVQAISGQGGWPLTAFLTPDGRPYFGGTYFPPEDRYGRPSFQRVLLTMAEAYQKRPAEVLETAASVMAAIEHGEMFAGHAGEPGKTLLATLIESIMQQFDERNGGFGSQPKFHHAGAIDLLLDAAGRSEQAGRVEAAKVVDVTLRKMAAGGVFDQLAGGFHRYSVDERWRVPHFEKLAYDNSELLKNYAHAYAATGDAEFAHVAREIVRWMDESFSDREQGGFYASQDADSSLDDDGDYFTWTRAEVEAVLTREEFFVAEAFYDLRAVGDMQHDPQKNVLHRGASVDEIAAALKIDVGNVSGLLGSAQAKMYGARLQRKTPYMDKTIYTRWNAMCCSAYIVAGRALGLPDVTAFGLRSLDRVLRTAWIGDGPLAHVVAYGEAVVAERISGVLEDYGLVANAALDAWEATGEMEYFTAAKTLADAMIVRFHDADAGGFFDTGKDSQALGALSARRKPLQDSPTPSGNALAATLLLRLALLTNEMKYETCARGTLEAFAGVVEHFGLYAASYGLALRRFVVSPLQICVIGHDGLADELEAAALRGYRVEKSVVRLRAGLGKLPPALAETLPHLPLSGGSFVVVCKGASCSPPVRSVGELEATLAG